MLRLPVRRLRPEAVLPRRMSEHAAGLDLSACLVDGDRVVRHGQRELIPTGLALAIPAGHEGQVRPRSGLAFRHGVTVLNAPGTIDADYRGELQVLLINLGATEYQVRHGDRIAQLVIAPVIAVAPVLVDVLPDADGNAPEDGRGRGAGGFGSTGR